MTLPPLTLSITYDLVSGLFFCELPNGARFPFSITEVQGKLRNNLELYQRAYRGEEPRTKPKAYSKRELRETIARRSDGVLIQKVGVQKLLDEIDLGDLEI